MNAPRDVDRRITTPESEFLADDKVDYGRSMMANTGPCMVNNG